VAAVQASPVFLDKERTVDKACRLIQEAGRKGAKLAVFPEAFVPGYPLWVWFVPARDTRLLRELYAELLANSVAVPGAAVDRLCEAASDAGLALAIGINEINREGSGASLYNSLLWIDAEGGIAGLHRKLIPTAGERLVHSRGDGSTLDPVDLPSARAGGLICWENYMPLARYALYSRGIQVWAAPTWDRGEPWISTLRHIAKEGRTYVIGCGSAMRRDDVPDRFAFKKMLPADDWINPGDSAVVDPDGKLLAGPLHEKEEILYATVDPAAFVGPKWQLDVAGHYARPDIFELIVHQEERPIIRFGAPLPPQTENPEPRAEKRRAAIRSARKGRTRSRTRR
jgi:nitrilase